jgi:hypothetical protein
MLHAALLLLMLEAANARPRFTISLKRSTQNLQLSTSSPADYAIYRLISGNNKCSWRAFRSDPKRALNLTVGMDVRGHC